ncbi:MAG: hypothetical protein QXJ51_05815 [Sulfolobales archaeon]
MKRTSIARITIDNTIKILPDPLIMMGIGPIRITPKALLLLLSGLYESRNRATPRATSSNPAIMIVKASISI